MIAFLTQPWPWYFGGAMISIVLFLLLWIGKSFGMSSNLRTVCSMMGGGKKAALFQFDWKTQQWNLMVALGVIVGGFLASNYIANEVQWPSAKKPLINWWLWESKMRERVLLPKYFFPIRHLQTSTA